MTKTFQQMTHQCKMEIAFERKTDGMVQLLEMPFKRFSGHRHHIDNSLNKREEREMCEKSERSVDLSACVRFCRMFLVSLVCANFVRARPNQPRTNLSHPIGEPILLPRTKPDGLEIPVDEK